MRIVRVRHQGESRYGLLGGARVELCRGTPFSDLTRTGDVLCRPPLLAPLTPGKMVAVWRNSRALVVASKARETIDLCYVLKPPSSFIGPDATIVLPPAASRVIFEGELGMVVGRRCKAVSEAHAPSFILGWTIVNEVTASDIIQREPDFPQYTRAKSFDTFGVFGPVVDTDFAPHSAVIRTRQNGELRQEFAVGDLVRGPYRILSELSHDMTLEPGDVIACGSSLGVQPIAAGDVIEIEITGLGVLRNPVASL
ncbi:DUF2437 domain-containing protein [Verticiella sediminum]|uniref:DUF2437 domain-containing protein n=1 Tax=Verticiella sediminum TaxID=1247510 RepID=A0A556A7E8_9BURK|nr:fumarylacetoacetate hydrolase family protein [Verticiella sediminum]TSH88804.1 DUF2437 domain-containing protein [Verticiella sediminum]